MAPASTARVYTGRYKRSPQNIQYNDPAVQGYILQSNAIVNKAIAGKSTKKTVNISWLFRLSLSAPMISYIDLAIVKKANKITS